MPNAIAPIAILTAMCGLLVLMPLQRIGPDTKPHSHLHDVLCQDAWSNAIRLGPIAIEDRILVFYDDGTIRQQIRDDTGIHNLSGKWSLEQTSEKTFLSMEGSDLLIHGRYSITHDVKKDVIELRYIETDTVMTFQRLKSFQRGNIATLP